MIRVYLKNGNRSNRGKSRLIYLLKDWGFDKFLDEVDQELDGQLVRFDFNEPEFSGLIETREKPTVPHPHVGVHPQKQAGLNMLGVYVPVGILQSDEARAIADVAEEFGTGEMRLTIFQNVMIPNIPDDQIDAAKAKLAEGGLHCEASFIRGGVAACTGNRYCKFANSDTKGNAIQVVDFLEEKITLDQPVNIHVTGCPHSCAQHYIGDIGLLACKVKLDDVEDPVEGYLVSSGGLVPERKVWGASCLKALPQDLI